MLSPNVSLINGTLVPKQSSPKAPVLRNLPTGSDDISKAVRCFLTGGIGKFGAYVAVQNALVFRTLSYTGTDYQLRQDVIALRLERPDETIYLGNSSVLPNIGRTVSFGREHLNRSVTDVQRMLGEIIPMLPFNVFTEAGLNLTKVRILERGPEETVKRKERNPKYTGRKNSKEREFISVDVHFTGASLFEIDGKHFLFDLDRRELEHQIFNPFLVELITPVQSIREAYETLKPSEVKEAEAKGLEVLRQGEWFFIPLEGELEPLKTEQDAWGLEKGFRSAVLRAGRNRPNRVSRVAGTFEGKGFERELKVEAVSGFVEHEGREHARLVLEKWYRPIANTSVQSFTITGDID